MTFSIVEGNIKHIKDPVKYVEVQNVNPASINSFKNSIASIRLEEFYSSTEKIQQKRTRKTKQNKGKVCTANNYIQ